MKVNLWKGCPALLWLEITVPGQPESSATRFCTKGYTIKDWNANLTCGSSSGCPSKSSLVRYSIQGSPFRSQSIGIFIFFYPPDFIIFQALDSAACIQSIEGIYIFSRLKLYLQGL
jgi:hypothetical protein